MSERLDKLAKSLGEFLNPKKEETKGESVDNERLDKMEQLLEMLVTHTTGAQLQAQEGPEDEYRALIHQAATAEGYVKSNPPKTGSNRSQRMPTLEQIQQGTPEGAIARQQLRERIELENPGGMEP